MRAGTPRSPTVAQLCEHARRLIASTRTQAPGPGPGPGAGPGLEREQVIRALRFAAQRRDPSGSASPDTGQIITR
jgi:hypothetical protein